MLDKTVFGPTVMLGKTFLAQWPCWANFFQPNGHVGQNFFRPMAMLGKTVFGPMVMLGKTSRSVFPSQAAKFFPVKIPIFSLSSNVPSSALCLSSPMLSDLTQKVAQFKCTWVNDCEGQTTYLSTYLPTYLPMYLPNTLTCGFESWHCILDGYFSHWFVVKLVMMFA